MHAVHLVHLVHARSAHIQLSVSFKSFIKTRWVDSQVLTRSSRCMTRLNAGAIAACADPRDQYIHRPQANRRSDNQNLGRGRYLNQASAAELPSPHQVCGGGRASVRALTVVTQKSRALGLSWMQRTDSACEAVFFQ